MGKPIKVGAAPGLVWIQRANDQWVARWQCRTDILQLGFLVKSVKLGTYTSQGPTVEEWAFISDTCKSLQQEMLMWRREKLDLEPTKEKPAPEAVKDASDIVLDGTLAGLIRCFTTDPDSPFQKIRYYSKQYYRTLCGLIEREYGSLLLSDTENMRGRKFRRWHENWAAEGKLAGAHGKMGMLRTLFGYGATILEDPDCIRLKTIMSGMKFETPKYRTERLTAAQAVALRAAAHKLKKPSIALAQAFQFELMLRQKDVIGEWVPLGEPGMSDIYCTNLKKGWRYKWLRGIRWEEIDENMVLSHITSKRQKRITISLKNAPMVMEELALLGELPKTGPIIRSEMDGLPYDAVEFRRHWRICADAAGIPKTVRNMDSRAGAISEATDAGADLEHVRHAATHSNIAMTQRYSRGAEEKIAHVQKLRVQKRNGSDNT